MARVLLNTKWFEQVEPSTFTESEFEGRILLHAPTVYPDYHVLPFKMTVESVEGKAKADLAFISKEYDEWYVVEVEMGYHPFSGHVEPQVQILSSAQYGAMVAEYILKKMPTLDHAKTLELISNIQPKVLVIVNESKPEWKTELGRLGATLAIFELFHSNDDEELFRVDGEYPTLLTSSISLCSQHSTVPRFLEVFEPESLELPLRGRIKLRFRGCLTEWERVDAEGRVYLAPVGKNPLIGTHNYQIFRIRDETYMLQRS